MKNRGLPIVSVTGRITVFLFIFTIFISSLWVIGNFQDFVDNSLIYLITAAKYSSLVYIAFAFSYVLILIIAGRGTGVRTALRIILSIAGCIPAAAIFILMQIIISGLEPV